MARKSPSADQPPPKPEPGAEHVTSHPQRWQALPVSCLGVFLVVTALSSLNVALPDLQADLGASTRDLQWVVDSYAVVFGGLLLTGGALGDRLGRRATLVLGFSILAAASLPAALADSVATVIVARGVAGIGAALMLPATLAVLTDLFDGPERGKAIGLWSGLAGAGGAIGPAFGGWIIELAGWGAVFVLTGALAVLGVAASLVFVPILPKEPPRPADPIGSALSVLAIGGLLFAVIEAPAGIGHRPVIIGALVGCASVVAFVMHERRTAWPLLPLGVFADRRLRVGAGTLVLAAIGFNGVLFVASLLLQLGWGESALVTGLVLLPIGLVELGAATRSAALADRFGEGRVITYGLVLMAAAYLGLAATPTGNRTLFVVIAMVAGLGNGMVIPLSVGRVVGDGSVEMAGVRAGVNETAIEIGASLGVAVLGGVQRVVFAAALPVGVVSDSLISALEQTDEETALAAFDGGARAALIAAAVLVAFALPWAGRAPPPHTAT